MRRTPGSAADGSGTVVPSARDGGRRGGQPASHGSNGREGAALDGDLTTSDPAPKTAWSAGGACFPRLRPGSQPWVWPRTGVRHDAAGGLGRASRRRRAPGPDARVPRVRRGPRHQGCRWPRPGERQRRAALPAGPRGRRRVHPALDRQRRDGERSAPWRHHGGPHGRRVPHRGPGPVAVNPGAVTRTGQPAAPARARPGSP